METQQIIQLTPDELRDYMDHHRELQYVLVDVRQPGEYQVKHIPGAILFPLSTLESQLYELPDDRDLVFYCHSGGRSLAASSLALEGEVTHARIYNLDGGIMAWDGKTLPGYPRMNLFDPNQPSDQLLLTAMNLEKGAFRFYKQLSDILSPESFTRILNELSRAETAHARLVHRYLENPQPFEQMYDGLEGNILEGGMDLEDALASTRIAVENQNLFILEIALTIEYSAFDLYRNLAERTKDGGAREAFFSLAQAEKSHMRKLIRSIETITEATDGSM